MYIVLIAYNLTWIEQNLGFLWLRSHKIWFYKYVEIEIAEIMSIKFNEANFMALGCNIIKWDMETGKEQQVLIKMKSYNATVPNNLFFKRIFLYKGYIWFYSWKSYISQIFVILTPRMIIVFGWRHQHFIEIIILFWVEKDLFNI